MFRRTPHENRTTSLLSTRSLNSLTSANTNLNPTPTNNNNTDEEAHLNEKSPSKKNKTKKPKLTIPTPRAPPAEIRTFFTTLLTTHDASLADDSSKCEAIVSAWKIGRGAEMRQYGPAMYLDMFGREYGWIMYREVKLGVRGERFWVVRRPLCELSFFFDIPFPFLSFPFHSHSIPPEHRFRPTDDADDLEIPADSFIVGSFLLEVLTISLIVHVDGIDEGVEVVVILASVVGMLTLLVSLIILCAGSSPARIVERDLRTCSKALVGAVRL